MLARAFDLWWPQLEAALAAIPSSPSKAHPASTMEEKMDKVLSILEKFVESTASDRAPAPSKASASNSYSTRSKRPRAFIGSSSEGLAVANAIQELLDDPVAECTIWNQGVFGPSSTFIESLHDSRLLYDFAVIVLTSDDTATKRGITAPVPRDNLLFELGLFAGALGRARTFLVLPSESPPRLPSDLSGVTTTSYRSRTDGNLVAALGPATSQIKRAMGIANAA